MTDATEALNAPAAAKTGGDTRTIAVVSAAHFVSHYFILLLPPLFAFVREDYGVSYTELGLALATFNVVSAVLQTPAGFLVDWLGARILLIAGIIIGAVAFAVTGLTHSFWILVAMFGVAGLGNTVYHPADYALLSHRISAARISQAYSVHTFAGMLGSAVAPVSLLLMQSMWGWRGAFIGSAVLGFAVAAFIMLAGDDAPAAHEPKAEKEKAGAPSWHLLLSAPILLNFGFFALQALYGGGLQYYSVVALNALYGTPVSVANNALTGYLLLAAFGVLAGGVIATRTPRHGLVAMIGLAATALFSALVAGVDLGTAMLILTMSAAGFFSGVIMPSRDMIVREITPPGSFGKVFGFVTNGFNVGGIIAPLIFGAMMDHGSPGLVFLTSAAFCLLAVMTVATGSKRAAPA